MKAQRSQNISLLRFAIIWCFFVLVANESHKGTRARRFTKGNYLSKQVIPSTTLAGLTTQPG